MNVIVDTHITIHPIASKLAQPIIESLTIPNPKFHQLSRMGKTRAMFGVPRDFVYYVYDRERSSLSIPIGCLSRLQKYFTTHQIEYTLHDHRVSCPPSTPFRCATQWRDYQEGIIDRINPESNTQGILQLSTGWGKSFLALKLATHLQQRTLIVVPRHSILEQFQKDIKTHMGIDAGIIQGTKFDIKDITVATIQTLQKRKAQLQQYKDYFGMVIVDEADRSIPTKSITAINLFCPKYRYGLTATPDRSDGQGPAITIHYGPILVNEKTKALLPRVRIVNSPHYIPISVNYADIIQDQTTHEARNQLIADIVEEEIHKGRKVLVLTKRVEHYKTITGLLPQSTHVRAIGTKATDDVEDIKVALHELRNVPDSYSVLLSTFSLLSTGVDIPSLDTLVIAGDLASSVLTIQSVGRILRIHEDKPQPTIIDINDIFNPILMKQARKRKALYKQMGWDIM